MRGSCSSVSKLLGRYFDQEVTDQEKALVEDHLRECRACHQALKAMEDLRILVKAPVEEAARREDFPWMWQRIQNEMTSQERTTGWESLLAWLTSSAFFRKRVWIPAMAAAAIVVLIASPLVFKKTLSSGDLSVVEYVESSTHNVMIYQLDQGRMTVIWLLEGPEKETSTS